MTKDNRLSILSGRLEEKMVQIAGLLENRGNNIGKLTGMLLNTRCEELTSELLQMYSKGVGKVSAKLEKEAENRAYSSVMAQQEIIAETAKEQERLIEEITKLDSDFDNASLADPLVLHRSKVKNCERQFRLIKLYTYEILV